jgi:hypothetical protein
MGAACVKVAEASAQKRRAVNRDKNPKAARSRAGEKRV